MYEYAATLLNVIDADTLRLDVDLGFHIHTSITVRLARIDAPERGSIPGLIALNFAHQQLATATDLQVNTRRSEKYGRWLGEITYTQPPNTSKRLNLSDVLLAAGHAKPYGGGKRTT